MGFWVAGVPASFRVLSQMLSQLWLPLCFGWGGARAREGGDVTGGGGGEDDEVAALVVQDVALVKGVAGSVEDVRSGLVDVWNEFGY